MAAAVQSALVSTDPALLKAESIAAPFITGIAIIALFFGGLGGWAYVAPLNGAVLAPAVVRVEGNRKSVQHLDGGIVAEIRIAEGDRVERDQVLIVLDTTQAQAVVTLMTKQFDALQAQEARLVAEQNDLERITFPRTLLDRRDDPAIRTLLASEELQFSTRLTALRGQVSLLRQKSTQLQQQIRGSEAQLRSQVEQLRLIREELVAAKELFEKGHATLVRVRQLERNASALEGQAGDIDATIARLRQQIAESELQAIQLRNERFSTVAAELRDTQGKLLDMAPRLSSALDNLQRAEIRAPESGFIVGLTAFTVGGVIARGERIMDIVPDKEQLVLEAAIGVDDITEVTPGMTVEVSFAALKQRTAPIIYGTLTQISADRISDPRGGMPYFRGIVTIPPENLAEVKDELRLAPGMNANVMIPTTARTALSYLIRPFTASFEKAFREK
ncbi:MAG: HlyD family type I secretion periplasmic adaptor subunit [Magnetospirillum sp.]|nr:HlyD family type I secretion periplasmic adaptor subunit [Magnetospirillum sp.]